MLMFQMLMMMMLLMMMFDAPDVVDDVELFSGDFFSDRSHQKSCSEVEKAEEQQTLTSIQVSRLRMAINHNHGSLQSAVGYHHDHHHQRQPILQQCTPRQQCCKPIMASCGCGESALRNSCQMPTERKTYEVQQLGKSLHVAFSFNVD